MAGTYGFDSDLWILAKMDFFSQHDSAEAAHKFVLSFDRDRQARTALEERYPVLRPDRLPPIVPKWDLSEGALKYNELREDILARAVLHIAAPSAFLGICTYPSDYATDDLERRSSSHKLRRILDLWASKAALTPPMFAWLQKKLIKQDGHHRTLLAFALQATEIPFYCDQPIEMDGIKVYRRPTPGNEANR